MSDRIHDLLHFWFGEPGLADLPNSDRTQLWFGDSEPVKQQLATLFPKELNDAVEGKLTDWSKTARGRLALILVLDQFPRYVHRNLPEAFVCDPEALRLCEEGLQLRADQSLTLIERVFFYMPLVHAESVEQQEKSIRLYQELVTLSMSETTQIYQLFLAYAYAHFRIIKEFGRFPQRNKILGRESTEAEEVFLKKT
ncbi:MAG TPA: DUF924 family protein [Gammaproteobacteria bacterium]|jgi:uncharacterized protein (DUF924 family)|nr:DUF924 family protein [Gammaproteobacteria bacterium]